MDGEFEIGSSIPVLRMFDEATARAFYVDNLGSRWTENTLS
jgi:hypothetical protein